MRGHRAACGVGDCSTIINSPQELLITRNFFLCFGWECLALRIPKPFALEADLDKDESVNLRLGDGKIVVEKSQTVYALDDLLSGITTENIHAKVDSEIHWEMRAGNG